MDREIVEDLAKYAGVPLLEWFNNHDHPTQVLQIFLSNGALNKPCSERFFVYAGDGRNMWQTFDDWCCKDWYGFQDSKPQIFVPDKKLLSKCHAVAKETGAKITITGG